LSLDFYYIEDNKRDKLLFSINNNEVDFFVNNLRDKTGIVIDMYGTTRIYNAQIAMVLKSFKENKNIKFVDFLRVIYSEGKSLIIEGD